jgi:hypothetical protein
MLKVPVEKFFFFLEPFEYIVKIPKLFLPALFLLKILKILKIFLNFNKKILFLNLSVFVVGLNDLIYTFYSKYKDNLTRLKKLYLFKLYLLLILHLYLFTHWMFVNKFILKFFLNLIKRCV